MAGRLVAASQAHGTVNAPIDIDRFTPILYDKANTEPSFQRSHMREKTRAEEMEDDDDPTNQKDSLRH